MELKFKKTCLCGREYKTVPPKARYFGGKDFPGYYFECECKSTLYWPDKKAGGAA